MISLAFAIPCRTDEPDLVRTLERVWRGWEHVRSHTDGVFRLLVCVNGEPGRWTDLTRRVVTFAEEHGQSCCVVDLDRERDVTQAPAVVVACTAVVGKANAWNRLRQRLDAALTVFLDADVDFGPEAVGELLATLVQRPDAVIASARTQAAPRPTWFERVQAVPYAIPFRNLSPQFYAARTAALPIGMPDDLVEPERWLELVVGRARVVHAPGTIVRVRLPASLVDFWRQRVRIELGKVQIAEEYPGLAERGTLQPGMRIALRSLPATDVARLAVYVALRRTAHLVARWRYRRGRTAGIWQQAVSTKSWAGG